MVWGCVTLQHTPASSCMHLEGSAKWLVGMIDCKVKVQRGRKGALALPCPAHPLHDGDRAPHNYSRIEGQLVPVK